MTAFYMFRAIFMTFEGEFKGGADQDPALQGQHDSHAHVSLHESPGVMLVPLIVLLVPAILAGIAINPVFDIGIVPIHWLSHFLGEGFVEVHTESFDIGLAALSLGAALLGILLAFLMYKTQTISAASVTNALRPVHTLLYRKYFMDELYEDLLIRKLFYGTFARGLDWVERSIVDRVFNFIGWFSANIGGTIRQAQTGQLQGYAAVITVGILVMFGVFLFIR
jgi:NADH-quinone oxidoreductase subunit L